MSQKEPAREIEIITWMSTDPDAEENLYDFRAIPQQVIDEEDEVEVDPKGSGAPESVESSESTEPSPASPASAEKGSTSKESEPSTQTSSSPTTTAGKPKQPA